MNTCAYIHIFEQVHKHIYTGTYTHIRTHVHMHIYTGPT